MKGETKYTEPPPATPGTEFVRWHFLASSSPGADCAPGYLCGEITAKSNAPAGLGFILGRLCIPHAAKSAKMTPLCWWISVASLSRGAPMPVKLLAPLTNKKGIVSSGSRVRVCVKCSSDSMDVWESNASGTQSHGNS